MPIDLLNFEDRARKAVQGFWMARQTARRNQIDRGQADSGERAGVTAGRTWTALSLLPRIWSGPTGSQMRTFTETAPL